MADHAKPVSADHWIHIEESPRRVRVTFGGETLADSRHALLLREAQCVPAYYFPHDDVRTTLLQPSGHRTRCPDKGEASYWAIRVGGKVAENAAWRYLAPTPAASAIEGYTAFRWNLMDAWYEEDEEVFVHARDPYKRVDVLQSARHVRIVVRGETVAETRRPRLLFETGLPVRYYIPPKDVRQDLLMLTDTASRCPYKGIASYWSVTAGGDVLVDLVWGYLDPIPECPKIRGLLCFFQEREVVLYVDGEEVPRPTTRWSR